jgi:hypothetical protein
MDSSGKMIPVVSPQVYAQILDSKRLRKMLLPEGLLSSPYEVLDYNATLILHDGKGNRATLRRTQTIRFLQDQVSALLDHAWGDGVLVTGYRHSAGAISDSFKDQGVRHMVVDLKHPRSRGELLTFSVEREVREAFLSPDGWVETTIDHPVRHLRRRVIFPKERRAQWATLQAGASYVFVPIVTLDDGRTCVEFEVSAPQSDLAYRMRFSW